MKSGAPAVLTRSHYLYSVSANTNRAGFFSLAQAFRVRVRTESGSDRIIKGRGIVRIRHTAPGSNVFSERLG